MIRDIQRKSHKADKELSQHLKQAQRIYEQQRKDKGKVYSVHALEVECISKGKAHKRYEFGVKVSVGTSSRGGWHVAAQAHPGNPYDGHTLKETLEQVRRMVGDRVKQVFVDRATEGTAIRGGDRSARGQAAQRQDRQAAVEVDEKASGGGTGDQSSETRASDESQSTERNPRRSTQRRAQCSGNELQEVAQASGEALALHPMDAEAGRNTTSHAFQSEHCRSTPFTQLKTTFSASTK